MSEPFGHDPLTRMQRSVLQLAVQGKSNAAIGVELGITRSTVKKHLSGVRERLGLDDDGQRWLVRAAYALGRTEPGCF